MAHGPKSQALSLAGVRFKIPNTASTPARRLQRRECLEKHCLLVVLVAQDCELSAWGEWSPCSLNVTNQRLPFPFAAQLLRHSCCLCDLTACIEPCRRERNRSVVVLPARCLLSGSADLCSCTVSQCTSMSSGLSLAACTGIVSNDVFLTPDPGTRRRRVSWCPSRDRGIGVVSSSIFAHGLGAACAMWLLRLCRIAAQRTRRAATACFPRQCPSICLHVFRLSRHATCRWMDWSPCKACLAETVELWT